MPRTLTDAQAYLEGGRSKQDRPLANNTRLVARANGAIAVRLHATDVVTFLPDGTIMLNSGGWRTNTTADRIRNYSPAHLYSDHGVWYVRAEPDPNDPRPAHITRSIPHPFEALDPGDEPIKSQEGCLAGEHTVVNETRREAVTKYDQANGIEPDEPYEYESDYFVGYRTREVAVGTCWRAERWGGYGETTKPIDGADETKAEQCPHCAAFDRSHELWERSMNGERWGNHKHRGWAQYQAFMQRFGTKEAWLEAAREDLRTVRARNQAIREWEERNRVIFEDGMVISGDGYALRPDPKAIAREERKRAKLERKRARIAKFVNYCMDELANGRVPMPGPGDCWGCLMRDPKDHATEAFGTDHLEAHIKERYAVPSMFINALLDAGYRPEGVGIYLDMREGATHMGIGPGETRRHPVVRTALRRYLTSRLIPEMAR